MEALEELEGSKIVDWVGSSCEKLEESIYSCDANRTYRGFSNGACKKQYYLFDNNGEKLPTTWEEKALDKYRFIVKKLHKIPN